MLGKSRCNPSGPKCAWIRTGCLAARVDCSRRLGPSCRKRALCNFPANPSLLIICTRVSGKAQSRPPAQAHIKGLKVRQGFRLGENECLGTREQFVTVDNKLLAARHDGMLSSTATGLAGR